jgi:hypothetical protein
MKAGEMSTLRIRFAIRVAVVITEIIQRAAVEHGQTRVQQVAGEET